jgi:serine/threonine protein kinase
VVDGRADLFSLGVLLFEALTGERPYDGGSDPATILLILQGEHPSLQGLVPDAPEGLCRVIEGLIDPDRDNRPISASALVEQLDEFPPSPRARRELAKMVGALRREPDKGEAGLLDSYRSTPATGSRSGVVSSTLPAVSTGSEGLSEDPETQERKGLHVNASALLAITIVAIMLVGIFLFAMRMV